MDPWIAPTDVCIEKSEEANNGTERQRLRCRRVASGIVGISSTLAASAVGNSARL
ncbi:hypothetical protein VTN77DRAFT_4022 [Rasamsonia byssochlamydoides]|uniref:uncharacterized protein n=1 Tax=Rasamsonia byssochlamydoides TaxID=89139 RepID=UPI0037444BE3